MTDPDKLKISLINILGQSLKAGYKVVRADRINIDISGLNDGVYLLSLVTGEKTTTHKVVIRGDN